MNMLLKALNEKTTAMYVNVTEAIRGFKRDEKGVTAVEYAIVIAGVAAVVAVIFGEKGAVQTMLTEIFGDIKDKVNESMGKKP
ncbi:TPA: Flp family type IVb pilin [Salmonella enterica]